MGEGREGRRQGRGKQRGKERCLKEKDGCFRRGIIQISPYQLQLERKELILLALPA
jgi:hypothetical protein